MKSPLLKRSLAAPGHLQSFYYFLPTTLQYGLLVLGASIMLLALSFAS